MTRLEIKSPLNGFLMPLEQVPDPVFSAKLLGDGIAIDPISSTLCAPCDGRIIQLHNGHHSLTVATAEGIELLLHIGLDTVELAGAGFSARVREGDEVTAGDPLIDFDIDYLATHAPSLLTMVIVTNGERVAGMQKARGQAEASITTILELNLNGAGDGGDLPGEENITYTSDPIFVANDGGLHARPAAVLSGLARQYDAAIQLLCGQTYANAKSLTSLMNLDVRQGDRVTLEARGRDAVDAINALGQAILNGLGEAGKNGAPVIAPAATAQPAIAAPAPRPAPEDPQLIKGVTASPGIAVGNVYQFRRAAMAVDAQAGSDPLSERAALFEALAATARELQALQARFLAESDADKASIFAAQEELLHDPELLDMVQSVINRQLNAAYAWQTVVETQASRLELLDNDLLALRAADLRDAGRRVLVHLCGGRAPAPELTANTILIAEDLAPSDIAQLDRELVVGFATTLGGATSHAAVLARSLDLPAIAGLEARALQLPNGTPVILDATRAALRLEPSKEEIAYVVGMLRKRRQKRERDQESTFEAAVTTDGHRVKVMAALGSRAEAERAMALGADGVGLLRTEFLFLDRRTPPSEEEQAELYAAAAGIVGGNRPLTIRTLDAGGDKPLPYLPLAPEANPFLGERGIRISLDRPYLLRTQVRAILRASEAGGNVQIMFPMIATLDEWRMAKGLVDQEVSNLGVEPVPVGMMIEVPAAAIMAEQFAREAAFFSIGSNDLAQYVLAMDRGHPRLAPRVDALNPAVLRLIAQTTAGAQKHGRLVGVCGSLDGDPQAVPILIGLGVKELSVPVPLLPTTKAMIRAISLHDAHQKAKTSLALESAAEVRALFPLEDYEL